MGWYVNQTTRQGGGTGREKRCNGAETDNAFRRWPPARRTRPHSLDLWLAAMVSMALAVGGCARIDKATTGCEGQTCSDPGTCIVDTDGATCVCGYGYRTEGLNCVAT